MKRKALMIVLGIFACLVPFGLFANAASSEPSGWGVARLIEHDDKGSGSYPVVSMDSNGNAIAVWDQSDGSNPQIVSNIYTKGVGWGDAEYLTSGSTKSMSPEIAVNSRGNATVVWRYFDGMWYNTAAIVYHPETGWGQVAVIDIGTGEIWSPKVDMNDHGYAIAIWGQYDGSRYNIHACVYMPGAGWGTATLIENDNTGSAYSPRVAISPKGEAIAVWHQYDGAWHSIYANRYSLTTGWGTPVLIETDNSGDAFEPMIDMDSSGNAVVVWRQYDGMIFNVVSNRYNGGVWSSPEIIETGDGQVQPPINVAVDNDGYALAVWHQYDGLKYDIISNLYTPGEGWGEEEVIEDGDGNAETPHLDIDASGNAIAVWRQYDGYHHSIFANRFVKGNGWGKAEVLETRLFSADVPRVSVDPSGDAIVVWYQYDGYRFNIWSNRYVAPDTTPPALTLSSPENGIESNTNAVTVSGITEPGSELDINGIKATVKSDGSFSLDLFLNSGENTIVVRSTDGSGNFVEMTRTVTYTDPLVDEIASLTNALNDLSLSLSSILGNISDIEDDIASIKEMMGTMNTSDNTSSIIEELEILTQELEMAKEDLTLLKERLSAIEGEGNETVDLSGILDMIDALEYDIDRNDAEISTLKNDVSSLTSDVDALNSKKPSDDDDLDKKVSTLQSLVTVLGAVLLITIIFGILFFIVLLVLSLRSKGSKMEE